MQADSTTQHAAAAIRKGKSYRRGRMQEKRSCRLAVHSNVPRCRRIRITPVQTTIAHALDEVVRKPWALILDVRPILGQPFLEPSVCRMEVVSTILKSRQCCGGTIWMCPNGFLQRQAPRVAHVRLVPAHAVVVQPVIRQLLGQKVSVNAIAGKTKP